MTPEQTREFQRRHVNHLGRPLVVDGVVGAQTAWALDVDTLCADRKIIIRAAQSYLGLVEDPIGANDDAHGFIGAWLRRCGAERGDPWCAAFASYCLAPANIVAREPGAQRLGKRFAAVTEPVAGDLFWFPTGSGWTGHIGIVTGTAPREIMTIEGNCNHAVRCVRRPRAGLHFSRPIDDASGTAPGVVARVPLAPASTR